MRRFDLTTVVISIIISILSANASFGQSGDAGQAGAFLRYGVGARALGMGKVFTAVANDASAIYWNPAGLMGVERKEFASMYTNLFYDSRYTYFAIAFPRLLERPKTGLLKFLFGPESSWGTAWVNLTTADFDQRDQFNQPLGEFDVFKQAFFLCFAREWVGSWGILNYGVNFKLVNEGSSGIQETEKLKDVNPGWGRGFDLGLTFQAINCPVLKVVALKYLLPLTLGVNIQNLLRPEVGMRKGHKEIYPTVFRYGFSYRIPLDDWNLLLAYDQERYSGRKIGHYGGVEVSKVFRDLYPCLRLGFNNRTGGFTLGGGAKFRFAQGSALRIDYAFGHHGDLKSDSRFFLTLESGKRYDASYFYELVKVTKESEIKKSHLHIIAKYPNERVTESAIALADSFDTKNADRYYPLIPGVKRANYVFYKAKKALRQGKDEEAKKKAREAIRLYTPEFNDPKVQVEDSTLLNFGEALMIVEKWAQAADTVIAEVENPSLRYYYQLGVCCKNLRKWDDAIEGFREGIKKYGQDEKSMRRLSFLGLGEALMAKGNYAAAIDTFEVITREFQNDLDLDYPRYPPYEDDKEDNIRNIVDDAQYLIGESYLKLGNREKALNAFAKVGRFCPDLEKAKDGSAEEKIEELVKEY